jgi:hypothetical protein
MKEIRVAIQAEEICQLVDGLKKVIQRLQEKTTSGPIFHSNGIFKFRYVIMEDAEIKSNSFNEELPG